MDKADGGNAADLPLDDPGDDHEPEADHEPQADYEPDFYYYDDAPDDHAPDDYDYDPDDPYDLPDLRARGLAADVAANIRFEAARRELSQQDLAEMIGRSRAAVSARYRGKVPWTIDEVGRIAEMLGVPPGELLAVPRPPSQPRAW
ncbi:helix-turn-helix domain-containing protein [Georgenia sp. AZ-5]|uniref:helix-turn-helix domain-containing protein n=1 Tax=Georgenia sp. AZ-5 TaxID=3367526 RepID=UPI003754B138